MIYTLNEILGILRVHKTTYYRYMKKNPITAPILSQNKRKFFYTESEKVLILENLFLSPK